MCKILTLKQKKFVEEYLKNGGNAYKAYLVAFPASRNWKRNAVDSQACILLRNEKIASEISERKKNIDKKLEKSCILSKKKILNEIIRQYSEAAASGSSERGNSTQLLKLLAQIAKLTDNAPNITINNNNQTINEVIGYLDL